MQHAALHPDLETGDGDAPLRAALLVEVAVGHFLRVVVEVGDVVEVVAAARLCPIEDGGDPLPVGDHVVEAVIAVDEALLFRAGRQAGVELLRQLLDHLPLIGLKWIRCKPTS